MKFSHFLILFIGFFSGISIGGELAHQHRQVQVGYHDTQRHGHYVTATVTYAAALENSSATVPLLVFSHGLLSYGDWFPFLRDAVADAGILYVSLTDYQGPDVSTPYEYGADMVFLLEQIAQDPKFPLYPRVDKTRGMVAGHSEGGAGAFAAGNAAANLQPLKYNASFHAAFTFSGCLDGDMSYVDRSAGNDQIPWLVLAGSLDCLCRLDMEQHLYDLLPGSCKYFVDMIDATHCGYMDAPTVFMDSCFTAEEVGGGFCHVGHHTLAPATQWALEMDFVMPWLRWQLQANRTAQAQFASVLAQSAAAKKIATQSHCS